MSSPEASAVNGQSTEPPNLLETIQEPAELSLGPAPARSDATLSLLKACHRRIAEHKGDPTESARNIEIEQVRTDIAHEGPGVRVYGFLAGLDMWRKADDKFREVAEMVAQGVKREQGLLEQSKDSIPEEPMFPQFSLLLPELQPLVLDFCDNTTLVSLLTVSRTLSAHAHELLYKRHVTFLRNELSERWSRITQREQRGWDVHVKQGAEVIAAEIFAVQNEEANLPFPSPKLQALQQAYRQAWIMARRSLMMFQRQAAAYGKDLAEARTARDEILDWLEARIGKRRWLEEERLLREWMNPDPPVRGDEDSGAVQ